MTQQDPKGILAGMLLLLKSRLSEALGKVGWRVFAVYVQTLRSTACPVDKSALQVVHGDCVTDSCLLDTTTTHVTIV